MRRWRLVCAKDPAYVQALLEEAVQLFVDGEPRRSLTAGRRRGAGDLGSVTPAGVVLRATVEAV